MITRRPSHRPRASYGGAAFPRLGVGRRLSNRRTDKAGEPPSLVWAHYFEVQIDTKKNEPRIFENKKIEWAHERGTQVE